METQSWGGLYPSSRTFCSHRIKATLEPLRAAETPCANSLPRFITLSRSLLCRLCSCPYPDGCPSCDTSLYPLQSSAPHFFSSGLAGSATRYPLLPVLFLTPNVSSEGPGTPAHSLPGSAMSEWLPSWGAGRYSGKHCARIEVDDRLEEQRARGQSKQPCTASALALTRDHHPQAAPAWIPQAPGCWNRTHPADPSFSQTLVTLF